MDKVSEYKLAAARIEDAVAPVFNEDPFEGLGVLLGVMFRMIMLAPPNERKAAIDIVSEGLALAVERVFGHDGMTAH